MKLARTAKISQRSNQAKMRPPGAIRAGSSGVGRVVAHEQPELAHQWIPEDPADDRSGADGSR
jgi:hypothetical protein